MLKKLMIFSIFITLFHFLASNCLGFDAVDSLIGNTYDNFEIKTVSRNEHIVTVEFADKNDEIELEMSTNNMTDEEIAENVKEIILGAREDLLEGYNE